ncbi:MAG TPA: DUF1343 domain-containing protein [Pyrinomonadaceae bacterium]|nr:DUF1343 domain-containing protein [Pyrinomonadaceae bacterium]
MSNCRHQIKLGLERLLDERVTAVKGARVALVCNQASVDHSFQHAADLLFDHPAINLTTLFGPQHGIRGDVQDNMIESEHGKDRRTGLPVYSLYSETREPTDEMLKDVETIVVDLPDIGCRIYTFAYTMANCMRAAARLEKKVIVCDRPNPIGGVAVAGNLLDVGHESFVGLFPTPTRPGLTMGELARLFNEEYGIGCDLDVIEMSGWQREFWYDDTDAPWVLPSPNIPTPQSTMVFPGTVHLEGTQMSEGRGTTKPFELVGAPYIEPDAYASELERLDLPGVRFRACGFMPTFQKHGGTACGGVQIHVTDRETFEPVQTGVAIVKTAFGMYPSDFRWKDPPYEYEYTRNPFDVIAGTTKLREQIERGDSLATIVQSWQSGVAEFRKVRDKYLLY